jgi:hypothetical protein
VANYALILEHRREGDGLPFVTPAALIPLKTKLMAERVGFYKTLSNEILCVQCDTENRSPYRYLPLITSGT